MAKYRKLPMIVEAHRWDGDWAKLREWFQRPELASMTNKEYLIQSSEGPKIRTPEGTMFVGEGDWIIVGVKGELYPCKPDIFEATYEPHGWKKPTSSNCPQCGKPAETSNVNVGDRITKLICEEGHEWELPQTSENTAEPSLGEKQVCPDCQANREFLKTMEGNQDIGIAEASTTASAIKNCITCGGTGTINAGPPPKCSIHQNEMELREVDGGTIYHCPVHSCTKWATRSEYVH